MKWCKTCGKKKKENEFWKDKRKNDGLQCYCMDCCKLQKRKAYLKNKEHYKKQDRKWRKKNRNKVREMHRNTCRKLRMEILNAYSGGNPKCNCCGESEIKFLAIDHIKNNGNKERKKLGFWGHRFYYWLKKNKFPKNGYQILCHNCNMAKAFYKICPHKQHN